MTAAGWYPNPNGPGLRYWDGYAWTEHCHDPTPSPAVPAASLIRSPEDAELAAATWMRQHGWPDARCTPAGPDGGIDVVSSGAVAQVKAHMVPVGRPDLQALYGVAASLGKRPLFFSLMDYTPPAREWADEVGLALFRFDHAGLVEPVNGSASALAHGGTPVAGGDVPWGVAMAVSEERAMRSVRKDRQGALQREQVAWVRPCWVSVQAVGLDYTVAGRRGRTEHRQVTVHFEMISPSLVSIGPSQIVPLGAGCQLLPTIVKPTALVKQYADGMKRLGSVKQPDAVARHRATLAELGVPNDAVTVSPSLLEQLGYPVCVGLVTSRAGQRLVCIDGVTGKAMPALSAGMTANLRWVTDQLARP